MLHNAPRAAPRKPDIGPKTTQTHPHAAASRLDKTSKRTRKTPVAAPAGARRAEMALTQPRKPWKGPDGGPQSPLPHTPSPWTWRGRFARRWSFQYGPGWFQEGSGQAKMASKIAQDTPKWFKIIFNPPPRAHKTSPGRLQVPSELSKEASKRPNSFKTIVFFNVFLPSRLFASDGLFRLQDGSKMAQEDPKRGPGGPQDGPQSAPNFPKGGPRVPQEAQFRAPTGGPC